MISHLSHLTAILDSYEQIFLLTDEQTAQCCLPVLFGALPQSHTTALQSHTLILPCGEQHKSIASVERIWDFLLAHHADRHSLLLNCGGGVICDIGGFAASTFMRGIPFVHIPTTLLSMVDAATGGKTGVNYGSPTTIKNCIGTFAPPLHTIIDCAFLRTLPKQQILSGYAEMLKHGLIADKQHYYDLLAHDLTDTQSQQFDHLLTAAIAIKEHIVAQDLHDHNIRQTLNFGHTIGHAIEALSISRSHTNALPHGFCVLYGMVAECYLSHILCGLDATVVSSLSTFMLHNYGAIPFTCRDFDELFARMAHDKKNNGSHIHFTLLQAIGEPRIAQTANRQQIEEAMEYLFSL